MVVSSNGKVNICCNDVIGESIMGDLNQDTIESIWRGTLFTKIREQLLRGRKIIPCNRCESILIR